MSEWEQKRIHDLLTRHFPGAWGEEPVPGRGSNVSVLRSINLDNDGHVDISTGALRRFSSRELADRRLQDGDLLLEASGGGPGKPVGRVALFRQEGDGAYASSNFFRTLRVDRRVADPSFLAWRLHWLHGRPEIWRFQQQTTGIINLRYADYLNTQIFLPPLTDQRRIAEILDTLDTQLAISAQIVDKLWAKQAAITDYQLDNVAAKEASLGIFLALSPRNGFSPKEVDDWTGLLALGLGCLTSSGFAPRQLKNVPSRDSRNSAAFLGDGDLLMSRANTRDLVGLVGRYRDIGTPCIYPDLMMRLTPTSNCRTEFLEIVLQSPEVRRQIQAMSQGTSESMVKISGATVKQLLVRVPEIPEQDRIVKTRETGHRASKSSRSAARSWLCSSRASWRTC